MSEDLIEYICKLKEKENKRRELENLAMKYVMNEITKNEMYILAEKSEIAENVKCVHRKRA